MHLMMLQLLLNALQLLLSSQVLTMVLSRLITILTEEVGVTAKIAVLAIASTILVD
jgi:hypothetical protein